MPILYHYETNFYHVIKKLINFWYLNCTISFEIWLTTFKNKVRKVIYIFRRNTIKKNSLVKFAHPNKAKLTILPVISSGKLADINPAFKKKILLIKQTTDQPVSYVAFLKFLKKLMQRQTNFYINDFLSTRLCRYWKGCSTHQLTLLSLIKKLKKVLDHKGFAGAVLMDFSKTFDTINHNLLIAKFYEYSFDKSSLKLLFSYLNNRWHRTMINQNLSSGKELLQGGSKGFFLGPPLFNTYLNDLYYPTKSAEVFNFADDTTVFACDKDLISLMKILNVIAY